ncbi:hypothetical protein [Cellvibrio japonicus]|uniref:Aminoglycoside phosphotransferase domain-containing protein n=1 Tax=Cellvibrio japonicus (strain Ueda107) TaxID=498211 RepID=B3PEF4_CELJU|nr:hypothetical protein [Cellvibrio japonicus]ACE85241.1 hypothetical protein CJA_3256 [Cellvibrio japonicus Ueda107]QEI13528.1 hypothetical protein FY117_15735 [Cellvibrio japonicus]QEI17102.1 hypothetical protein FY116_15740 [Cellvibrio japonicus]QEI20679.1 hypothetical protein FY115_15735 [Cellvibrio japonicus]
MTLASATPVSVTPALLDSLRPLRWFADKEASCEEFQCLDWALVSQDQAWHCLWILMQHLASERRYSFVIRQHPQLHLYEDATYSSELVHCLLACPDKRLPTAKGAFIAFNAACTLTAPFQVVPLEKNMTTNTLFKLSTPDSAWAVKFYRTLTHNNENEVSVLKALAKKSNDYAIAGTLEYQTCVNGQVSSTTLAIANKFMQGVPAYQLYSRSIKALFSRIAAGEVLDLSALTQVEDLYLLSFSIGANTAFFHQQVNAHYVQQGEQAFDVGSYVQCNRNRWLRVYDLLKQDRSLSSSDSDYLCHLLQEGYERYLGDAFVQDNAGIPASISHGDLHLSHLFIDPAQVSRCLLIDPAPRSLDEHEREFVTQSCLQDLKNLHRGLDYFSYDEIVDDLALAMGVSQLDAAHFIWRYPAKARELYPAHFHLLCYWSDVVFDGLMQGYNSQASHSSSKQGEVMQLFYFCRLLKEMEYNYAYERNLFKYCDYFYLRKFIDFPALAKNSPAPVTARKQSIPIEV